MPLRLIRRLAFGVVGSLLLLGLLVAASIPIDGLLGHDRIEAVSNVEIPGSGTAVRAYVARPSGPGPHPTVVMIHEWWGLNAELTSKADALASEGYVVVAPDTFRGSTTALIPRAIYQVSSTPTARVNSDLDAVYAWLAEQPDVARDRIGVVGFCYGGRAAVNYSLHNPALASTVTFYGMATTDSAELRALPGPVLGIFGGADNSISLEEVREFEAGLDAAGVPNRVTVYEGQPHAFVKGAEEIQRDPVQKAAWSEMLAFLRESLQQPAAAKAPPPFAASHGHHASDAPTNLVGLVVHSLQGH